MRTFFAGMIKNFQIRVNSCNVDPFFSINDFRKLITFLKINLKNVRTFTHANGLADLLLIVKESLKGISWPRPRNYSSFRTYLILESKSMF